jgi:hypothetical protein
MKAELILGGVNHSLTNLMRMDSRFKLVYEDAISAVFLVLSLALWKFVFSVSMPEKILL